MVAVFAVLAASALTPQWQYLPATASLPGASAVRKASPGEPALVGCAPATGRLLIASRPGEARAVTLRSGMRDLKPSFVRTAAGSTLVTLRSTDTVLEGLASQTRPLLIASDNGPVVSIDPDPAVARVVRECRSASYRNYMFQDVGRPGFVPRD